MGRDLWIRIKADVSGLTAGMAQAQKTVSDFDKALQQSAAKRQALVDLGNAAGKMGALAAAGVGLAVKSAMDWETAWTGVLKTVDGSSSQLSRLEGDLRKLAVSTGFAHGEVAAVAEAAGQLGISTEGVSAFTKTMLDMGVSTNLSAEAAATGLARLRNILGATEPEIANMGSTMVALGNNFATTEGEILDMSLRLAGAGRQAGLSSAQVLGLAAAMSSVGIEAEAGGTAMSLTMKRIGKEVETNGKKLGLFSKVAGMSAAEFKKAWGEDAGAALTAFVKGLSESEKIGMSTNAVLRELGVTGIREADALLRLSGNAEGLADALGMASDAWRENSALTEESGKFYATASQQMKQAWAGIKDNLIDIGASALPVVKDMSDALKEMTGAFSDLPPWVSESVLKFGALTAVLGTGTWAVSRAVTGFSNLAVALGGLAEEGGKVSRSALFARGGLALGGTALLALSSAAGDANDELGLLVDVAGPALLGFAVGGPWGAAIGAGAGLLKGLAGMSSDAADAQERLRDTAKEVAASIDGQTGAITANTEALARQRLAEKLKGGDSAFDVAKRAGVNLGDLTSATLGDAEAQRRVNEQVAEYLRMTREAAIRAGERHDEASLGGASAEEIQRTYKAWNEASKAWEQAQKDGELLGVAVEDLNSDLRDQRDAIRDQIIAQYEMAGGYGEVAKRLAEAAGGVEEYADRLATVPKEVQTRVEQMGAKSSLEDIKILAEAYGLTPEQVMTEIIANDLASGQLEIVDDKLVDLDGTVVKPSVRVDPSQALAAIKRTQDAINNMRGRYIPVTVQTSYSSGGRATLNADGGVWDYYANGGVRENHVAQIAPAGAWRVWAEPETGGEAYIPLAASKRQRSLEVWAETGKRLGAMGFADGGVMGGSGGVSYDMLAAAIGRARFELIVNGRQAGVIVQEGAKVGARLG